MCYNCAILFYYLSVYVSVSFSRLICVVLYLYGFCTRPPIPDLRIFLSITYAILI